MNRNMLVKYNRQNHTFNLEPEILEEIKNRLDTCSPYARTFNNVIRKLLGMEMHHERRGRPPGRKGSKRRKKVAAKK